MPRSPAGSNPISIDSASPKPLHKRLMSRRGDIGTTSASYNRALAVSVDDDADDADDDSVECIGSSSSLLTSSSSTTKSSSAVRGSPWTLPSSFDPGTPAFVAQKRLASDEATNTAANLARMFACKSLSAAVAWMASDAVTPTQRQALATVASLEDAWVHCDQAISENVKDQAKAIVDELYESYLFLVSSLQAPDPSKKKSRRGWHPRDYFREKSATREMSRERGYWMAQHGLVKHAWLPDLPSDELTPTASEAPEQEEGNASPHTFDAVVHFVQSGCGTGVHVGQGLILTCAHVVDALDDDTGANSDSDDSDDDGDDDIEFVDDQDGASDNHSAATKTPHPCRIGRLKLCMFADGRVFMAECVSQVESDTGEEDTAVMLLGPEIMLNNSSSSSSSSSRAKSVMNTSSTAALLPAARVAPRACSTGDGLFCVGNPSRMGFEGQVPPTWHTSVGHCQGYLPKSNATAFNAKGTKRQRNASSSVASSKRGGKAHANNHSGNGSSRSGISLSSQGEEEEDEDTTTYLLHSCWTYWGHSGAPLFSAETGAVCGLHCAWNPKNGMRHGQKVPLLHAALKAATTCTKSKEPKPKKKENEVVSKAKAMQQPNKKHNKAKVSK